MTTSILIGAVFLFGLGVVAGLSAPKIRAWFAGEVEQAKADIKSKL